MNLFFVLAGNFILHAWIGIDFTTTPSVLISLAAWGILLSTAGPLFMVLNSKGVILFQVILFSVFMVVSIVLKFVLLKAIGLSGVIWASVIPYAFLVVPFTFWRVNGLFAMLIGNVVAKTNISTVSTTIKLEK